MQIPPRVAQLIAAGEVTVAYRRWAAPRVKVGGQQLTAAGIIAFESVEVTDPETLTEADALAAGDPDLQKLRRSVTAGKDGDVYRIGVRWVGADPRLELRTRTPNDADDMRELAAAVDKLDRGRRSGPWTRQILEWIRDNPGVVSKELAALLGRELQAMKVDIRRLKALGLTISLDVEYRLSPRGEAYLDATGSAPRSSGPGSPG